MPHRRRGISAALLLLALPTAPASGAETPDPDASRRPNAPLHEEVLTMAGDPARPVTLEVTLFKPPGSGPFPLAVLNHGATKASASNRGERYRFTISAYYFLSRGYAVALPMMRGFAGSGGNILQTGCDLAKLAFENDRDMTAVIEALKARSDVDRTRVVVAGQSFGAWNTLGLGVDPPAGVRGLINFNAAIRTSDCHAQDDAMEAAVSGFGARTKLPSLWFYGDNDSIMPVATWRAMVERYTRAGGRAELVAFGPFGTDSHQILSSPESLPIWAPPVDALLARIGLPSATVYPEYLPYPSPPATNFADVSNVAAVPFMGDAGRALYERFLKAAEPRAFVIASNGSASERHGGYDPLGVAMTQCAKAGVPCKPYAVDGKVVWSGPKAGEPRVVERTVRMNVSTALGGFFSINPDCSSRGLPKVSVIGSPTHGMAVVGLRDEHPNFPPGNPYAACNAATVPAVGVTYTPAPGFAGTDALTIEELDIEGRRRVLRIELRVI